MARRSLCPLSFLSTSSLRAAICFVCSFSILLASFGPLATRAYAVDGEVLRPMWINNPGAVQYWNSLDSDSQFELARYLSKVGLSQAVWHSDAFQAKWIDNETYHNWLLYASPAVDFARAFNGGYIVSYNAEAYQDAWRVYDLNSSEGLRDALLWLGTVPGTSGGSSGDSSGSIPDTVTMSVLAGYNLLQVGASANSVNSAADLTGLSYSLDMSSINDSLNTWLDNNDYAYWVVLAYVRRSSDTLGGSSWFSRTCRVFASQSPITVSYSLGDFVWTSTYSDRTIPSYQLVLSSDSYVHAYTCTGFDITFNNDPVSVNVVTSPTTLGNNSIYTTPYTIYSTTSSGRLYYPFCIMASSGGFVEPTEPIVPDVPTPDPYPGEPVTPTPPTPGDPTIWEFVDSTDLSTIEAKLDEIIRLLKAIGQYLEFFAQDMEDTISAAATYIGQVLTALGDWLHQWFLLFEWYQAEILFRLDNISYLVAAILYSMHDYETTGDEYNFVADAEINSKLNDLVKRFPASIPWDIAAMLALLKHEPVAPSFTIQFGDYCTFAIDCEDYPELATASRNGSYMTFVFMLAYATPKLSQAFRFRRR